MIQGGVYLCGTIAGCTYEEARYGWRRELAALLDDWIPVLSPMRQEGHLAEQTGTLGAFAPDNKAIATQRAIVAKDKLDIHQCSIIVANFIGADRVSIGSVAEIGYASALGRTIVVIMESQGNIHDHIFVREMADVRVETVLEAAAIINSLLVPGV